MKLRTTIVLIVIGVLFLLHFLKPNTDAPEYDSSKDFLKVTSAGEDISKLYKNACYDCHSYETEYPWYSSVPGVGLLVSNHIDEGREHLNFSIWDQYDQKRKDHKLEEIAEEVGEGEMPLKGYVLLHSEAELSEDQLKTITDFAKSQMVNKE